MLRNDEITAQGQVNPDTAAQESVPRSWFQRNILDSVNNAIEGMRSIWSSKEAGESGDIGGLHWLCRETRLTLRFDELDFSNGAEISHVSTPATLRQEIAVAGLTEDANGVLTGVKKVAAPAKGKSARSKEI